MVGGGRWEVEVSFLSWGGRVGGRKNAPAESPQFDNQMTLDRPAVCYHLLHISLSGKDDSFLMHRSAYLGAQWAVPACRQKTWLPAGR